jgi:hypothetical protein
VREECGASLKKTACDDEADHQPSEFVDTLVERGWDMPSGDIMCQLAEEGAASRLYDRAGRVTRNDIGRRKTYIGQKQRGRRHRPGSPSRIFQPA